MVAGRLQTYSPNIPGAMAGARRLFLAVALSVVLAALTLERQTAPRGPAPVVMTTAYDPPRFGRQRPYRAHYRRVAR